MHLGSLIVAGDLATAACGLLNASYFIEYWWRRNGAGNRRIGAAALALISVAAVVEALFSQGLFWSQQDGWILGQPPLVVWALVRIPLLVATAFVSLLVLRRLRS